MPDLRRSDIIDIDAGTVTQGRTENGRFYVHQRHFDDAALERNKQLAQEDYLAKAVLGLHDDADLRAWISCPDVKQWNRFIKRNPGFYKKLRSPLEHERIQAVKYLYARHPEWFIQKRT